MHADPVAKSTNGSAHKLTRCSVSKPPSNIDEIARRRRRIAVPDLSEFDLKPKPQLPSYERVGSDIDRLYSRELGVVPLLSIEQEVELTRRMNKGDSQAREHLIRANLRLVAKIAREFDNCGLPILDLISEGNIGLMKAVDRFELGKGAKLSTYAAFWIRQSMILAIAEQSRTIRIPMGVSGEVVTLNRAVAILSRELKREPEDEEIAAMLETSVKRVRFLKSKMFRQVSLDSPANPDEPDAETLGSMIPDSRLEHPSLAMETNERRSMIVGLIEGLNSRERRIIQLRFGLLNGAPLSLEDIGRKFKITRERVRQIEVAALKQLRIRLRKIDEDSADKLSSMLGLRREEASLD